MEIKAGDMLQLDQSDGNRLVIIVQPDGVIIKADLPGTILYRRELTHYSHFLYAVERILK